MACSIHAAEVTALVLNVRRTSVSLTCKKLKAITELLVSQFLNLALPRRVNYVDRKKGQSGRTRKNLD